MEARGYTIKEAARMMGVAPSTIRYYDKEGLLPFVGRLASGYRFFTEKDLATLRMIDCLKKTGMPIKKIRQFSEWLAQGDGTLPQRYEMFLDRRREVEAAIAAGTEGIHENRRCLEAACGREGTAPPAESPA